jgi:hypothetical protein
VENDVSDSFREGTCCTPRIPCAHDSKGVHSRWRLHFELFKTPGREFEEAGLQAHIDAVQKGKAPCDVQRDPVAGCIPAELPLAINVCLSIVCRQRPPAKVHMYLSELYVARNLLVA